MQCVTKEQEYIKEIAEAETSWTWIVNMREHKFNIFTNEDHSKPTLVTANDYKMLLSRSTLVVFFVVSLSRSPSIVFFFLFYFRSLDAIKNIFVKSNPK